MPLKKLPLSAAMGSDIVTIFVGKKRKEFDVHKKLICQSSDFFSHSFEGPFKEGQENQMYMPEDNPEVFACFVDWLYRNPLPVVEDTSDIPKKAIPLIKADDYKEFGPVTQAEHLEEVARVKREEEERKKAQDIRLAEQFGTLLKLYFFAEKIFSYDLMNRTMDRIRSGLARYDRYFGHRETKQIYQNTCPGSMLRTFCAELIVYALNDIPDKKLDQLATLLGEIPELLKDILVECRSLAQFKIEMTCEWSDGGTHSDPRIRGEEEDTCDFHKHDSTSSTLECYKSEPQGFQGPCPACGYGRHGWDCCCH